MTKEAFPFMVIEGGESSSAEGLEVTTALGNVVSLFRRESLTQPVQDESPQDEPPYYDGPAAA